MNLPLTTTLPPLLGLLSSIMLDSTDDSRTLSTAHVSVLPKETLELLALRDGEVVLDATAGFGGHAESILKAAHTTLVAIDADPEAVARVQARLAAYGKRALVLEGNFADAKELLSRAGVSSINKALFDLGWNRSQLFAGRGLSFQGSEPLNMSYGPTPRSGFTAAEILNEWSEEALSDVFFGYGEERFARRIARAVVERRDVAPFETTDDLVEVIGGAVPAVYRRGRIHFATKTFQALRIAVNAEFQTLEQGVRGAWDMLAPGGRIAVISFHSSEDRIVKRLFAEWAKGGGGTLIVKKPLAPGKEELAHNPSARSAKLRVIEKVYPPEIFKKNFGGQGG